MWKRLIEMLRKELIQVLRDPRSRILLIGPPLLQTLIFGYAATLDIRHVPIAVVDYENTQESRDLISRFANSRYFDVRAHLASHNDIQPIIDRGEVLAVVQINSGFTEDLRKGQTAQVQAIVDSSNSNTALVSIGYINQVAASFGAEYQRQRMNALSPELASMVPTIALHTRPWYNPDLSSTWFFVPGVIGNILLVVVLMLTAFAVVREREIGTLEQIMVTPITRFEFIAGKTIPFFLVGLLNLTLISLTGILWFRVPLRGSIFVLFTGSVIFLLCSLGIGLLISTISKTQQQAMITGFFFIMPAIVLSGFGSPIASMPRWLQYATLVDPLRYYMVILRSVYLKGVGFSVLWPQMASMLVLGAAIFGIAVLRFSKSLD
ncbi:MAG TPA: ABC transporter permease [Terriglobales bacterium]